VLLVDVSEVEIKVCDRGLTGIAHRFHIFNDCRTGERQATQLLLTKIVRALRTIVCSCQSQLQIRDVIRWRQAAEWERDARFPWIQSRESEPVDFYSLYVLPLKNQVAVPS
jgi:hypothetical protein